MTTYEVKSEDMPFSGRKPRVAFVCTHNACRSQMAEALGKKLAGDTFESYSAGTELKAAINEDAQRLMAARHGIDMAGQGQRPKLISEIPAPDIAVLMGCAVQCPFVACRRTENWELDDPTGKTDEEFTVIIDEIERRVLALREELRRTCPPGAPGRFQNGAEADIFKALGDDKRLRIMHMIARNPGICSCKILEEFEMSQSTLSHHMKLLCEADLVSCEREGRWTHYTLKHSGLESAAAALAALRSEAEDVAV